MKYLLTVMAAFLLSIGCQKQAREILHPDLSPEDLVQAKANFFPKQDNIPTHKKNEIVVKFKPNTSKAILRNRKYEKIETATMKMARFKSEPYYHVNVQDEQKALAEFKTNPDVEWAGLNPTHTTQDIFVPNDPQWTGGQQWNLAAIEADKAWLSGNTGSKTVYIAVLDEGAGYWFCDYNSKVWTNEAEINGVTGVDDDNNGHIDDYRGWNYFDGNNLLYTGNDDHGTWCGSIIGAESGNNLSITSLAPNIKIIHYKFLADWGYDTEAAKAVDDIIWLKENKGLNIVAISNSWGGGGPTPILKEAIHRAALADINFVCAAGNSNLNTATSPSYPAAYDEPNVISVGASDQLNNKAFFSNYGTDAITGVDLFAPGVNCIALIPVNHQEGLGNYSGTSMACPLVAGAIGLVASVNPEFTYLQRQEAIYATVKKVTSLTPYCKTGGILNLNNPVFFGNTDAVIPDGTCGTPPQIDTQKPTTMTIILDSVREDQVTDYAVVYLRWTPPTDNSEITGLIFQLEPFWTWFLEGNAWTGYAFVIPMDRLYTITGRAVDSWGNQADHSNVIRLDYSGTPPPTDNIGPSIPQNLGATEITISSFLGSWNASTDNVGGSGMKDYKVHWRPKGQTSHWAMTFVTGTSYRPTNLFSDTTYEFCVMARDNADNFSDTSVILEVVTGEVPQPVPDTQAPTLNGSPTVSNITASAITFNHQAASDNVGVTIYTVNWREAGGSWSQRASLNLSETFSSLSQNTTYEFFYTASDAAGNVSVPSGTISGTTLNPPPPSECNIQSTLDAVSQALNVTLNWTVDITGTCTVSSTRLERKKGGNGTYTVVAFNPNSPYTDNVPNPGQYTYRLQIQSSTGQTFYSNEKNIKVNKK